MSRTTAPLLAFLSLSFSTLWIASCSDDEEQACTTGATRLCACAGRFQGAQSCLADGSYSECNCTGQPRQGNGGAGGDTGSGVFVGRGCTEDAQCGAGLECLTSDSNDFFGGGPAGGYCTSSCTDATQCTAIDPQSDCVIPPGGTSGLCVRTCQSLDPRSLAENKCLGRPDLACNSVAFLRREAFSGLRQPGWCLPQCGSDADCGGRRCDLGRGVCTDSPAVGLGFGARCVGNTDCASGMCVGVAPDEQFCSAPCVFGQTVGCGYGPTDTPREAGCLVPVVQGGLLVGGSEGLGDVGFCVELCTVGADCEQNISRSWSCQPSAPAQTRFNRPGVCFPPQDVADAGADGGDAGDASGSPVVLDASTTADGG
jgi:hypothetical protein